MARYICHPEHVKSVVTKAGFDGLTEADTGMSLRDNVEACHRLKWKFAPHARKWAVWCAVSEGDSYIQKRSMDSKYYCRQVRALGQDLGYAHFGAWSLRKEALSELGAKFG